MTYPAWFDLMRDATIGRKPVAMRVYAALVAQHDAFFEPQDCKAWAMAELLGVKTDSVLEALNTLVERGYLREHGRNENNVRRFTIVRQRGLPSDRDASAA